MLNVHSELTDIQRKLRLQGLSTSAVKMLISELVETTVSKVVLIKLKNKSNV